MVKVTNLGFPRIGRTRELKRALEAYWAGKIDAADFEERMRILRCERWMTQQRAGVDLIPSNDFSLYDHVLDTALMVNAVPARFVEMRNLSELDLMFALARGTQDQPALEMTKWWNTNYHYLMTEIDGSTEFRLRTRKPVEEFLEARALGIMTRPVLLSPVTFLRLVQGPEGKGSGLGFLPKLLPVYVELLRALSAAGAEWIQFDEPSLAVDLNVDERAAMAEAYWTFRRACPKLKFFLAAYFGRLGDNRYLAMELPVNALHLDLVSAPEELDPVLLEATSVLNLSLGLLDGRNIWRADLDAALAKLERVVRLSPKNDVIWIAPSCSLLHVPVDLDAETSLDPTFRSWLAFAVQKLGELRLLADAVNDQSAHVCESVQVDEAFKASREAQASRRLATTGLRPDVPARGVSMHRGPFFIRRIAQNNVMPLPLLPTTTIGSLPQTPLVRARRADYLARRITPEEYDAFLAEEITRALRVQEEIGLDVLVHGEFERNDMVEYFASSLDGFRFTENGWVQSYGSRCVKPPVIMGDVTRPYPMTVRWTAYAQSQTTRPVKGMLTGPVTMLQWSFVRDDLPRAEVCRQIALALRDEVRDLEAAGVRIIQVDEPALREGLPLRKADQADYLHWAVQAFCLCVANAQATTQIHTHMCYADVEDILPAIRDMGADVISLEASRSALTLLRAFRGDSYPNAVGPGVYDIHSPRIPSVEDCERVIRAVLAVFPPHRVWVNPDCGLKTRSWEEVRPALANMVEAARRVRNDLR